MIVFWFYKISKWIFTFFLLYNLFITPKPQITVPLLFHCTFNKNFYLNWSLALSSFIFLFILILNFQIEQRWKIKFEHLGLYFLCDLFGFWLCFLSIFVMYDLNSGRIWLSLNDFWLLTCTCKLFQISLFQINFRVDTIYAYKVNLTLNLEVSDTNNYFLEIQIESCWWRPLQGTSELWSNLDFTTQ